MECDSNDVIKWCIGCKCELKEPYIRCIDCLDDCNKSNICLRCFAKGFESERHKDDHAFELLRNDFSLWTDEKWTAGDELKLLEAIDNNGLGNWGAIAKSVTKKSSRQCEEHFWQFYLKLLGAAANKGEESRKEGTEYDDHPVPLPYKVSDDPPRPAIDSVRHGDMAGYSAPRGDFVTEFDNYAELNIKDIDFSPHETEVEQELKLTMVEIYNDRLRERARRKRIIAHYGLIDVWRLSMVWQSLENVVGKNTIGSFCATMKLIPAEEFQVLLEMIKYEIELQEKIRRLQEFRQVGLTKASSIHLYLKLKRRREGNTIKRSSFDVVLLKSNRLVAPDMEDIAKSGPTPIPIHAPSRRSAPPMDVTGLPGYSKLSEKERELCSTVRLVPDAYLEYKNILFSESFRNGYLRLAQARHLIKIDVNKTRKIYDFLAKEGLIRTQPDTSS